MFGLAEAEPWTITTYAGQAAENDLFLDHRADDATDLRAIDAMIQRLDLDWSEVRLGALRFEAQVLVAA
jgi:hypothetical protein